MGANSIVRQELRRLLVSVGRLPSNARGRADPQQSGVVDAALRKLLGVLQIFLPAALSEAVEDDQAYHAGIRRFFLEPKDAYSLDELAAFWRISSEDVREVFSDELANWAKSHPHSPDAFRVGWHDALRTSLSYNFFRPIDVERALGPDFSRVRPDAWYTVPLLIYVPRFMVAALEFDGVMSSSKRAQAARIEQYLFDLFPDQHRKAFTAACRNGGKQT